MKRLGGQALLERVSHPTGEHAVGRGVGAGRAGGSVSGVGGAERAAPRHGVVRADRVVV